MQATADSRTVKSKGAGILPTAKKLSTLIRAFPNNDISRCPAIRFAVKRTQRVIGRIRFLVISIMTMKDMRMGGVPWGTKWASMWFVFFDQPNITIANQEARDRGSVIVRWEVAENTCGYSARKLANRINKNVTMIMVVTPNSPFFKVKVTSFLKIANAFWVFVLWGCPKIQVAGTTKLNIVNKMPQLREANVLLGSNTENRFVIILFFCVVF